MMKILTILLLLFYIISCRNYKSHKNQFLKISNDIKLLDSINHFTMLPSQFNENYKGSSFKINNKEFMTRYLKKLNKNDINELIEYVKDTVKTNVVYADLVTLRKGDLALDLLTIVDGKLPLKKIIYQTFKESDTVSFEEFIQSKFHNSDNVFVDLLYDNTNYDKVNYKNRISLYKSLKKYIKQ